MAKSGKIGKCEIIILPHAKDAKGNGILKIFVAGSLDLTEHGRLVRAPLKLSAAKTLRPLRPLREAKDAPPIINFENKTKRRDAENAKFRGDFFLRLSANFASVHFQKLQPASSNELSQK